MTTGVACPPIILQFTLNNGQLAAGGYIAPTVGGVPTAVYQDSGLTTPLPLTAIPNQSATGVPLNSRGEISNASGASCQLFLTPNTVYTLTLYDATGNQIWIATYVNGVQLTAAQIAALSTSGGVLSSLLQTTAESAASVTPTNYSYAPGNVLRYGADPTGVALSDTALASAVAQASQSSGAEVFIPGGLYTFNTGVVLNANGIKVRGSGMGLTHLKANTGSISIFKVAQSNCTVESLTLDGGAQSSVDGLALAPANESVTNVVNQNNFNTFRDIQIQNCNNGLRMRGGPTVAGTDSGCFYNMFYGVFQLDCVRSVWMENSVNNGHGAPNRCNFYGCRGGSSTTVCNTGLQIDAGGTNSFFGVAYEGIANGTAPSTIPTAVVIANFAASGVQNIDNHFYGCVMEANTLDLNNASTTMQIYGGLWNASKFASGNVNPTVILTGDPAVFPFILPGMINGQGLTGFPSGFWGMSEEIADFNGATTYYNWQTYALSTSNITNVSSVANAVSNFRKLGNMVSWAIQFQFDASVGATQVTVTPPIAPNTAQYCNLGGTNPFYSVWVNNGSGPVSTNAGWTSAGKFFVAAPSGGWNTGGNNNAIQIQIEYHS